jgi:hypothetical protein
MYDVYLLAFHTPRRILYDRIKKHCIEMNKMMVCEERGKIYIWNDKAELILDKKDELNDKLYVCLKNGKLIDVKLTKKTIGELLKEVGRYF